jgi:cobalt-zinc-cadmium efflux system outer membrane protein
MLALLLLTSIGCRSYAPRPLDLRAYQRDWSLKLGADEPLAAFAAELRDRGGTDSARFDPADGLTLDEAQAVALLLNPDLRVLRLRAQAPLAAAREAGRWDDPELSFDVLRILSNVSHPWILGGGIGITLPLSGRLGVERELAWADYTVAWRQAVVAQWQLRHDLEQAWLQWSAAERETAVLRDYVARLEQVDATAQRLVDAGELPATESRVFQLDLARQRIELDRQAADADRQRLALLAMLGLTPDAPIQLVPSLAVPDPEGDMDAWRDALHSHPELLAAEAAYAVAEGQLQREIRRQYPDLTLGPVAGREDGQTRLGLGGAMPLPIWNRNLGAIREAEAERETSRAEAEAMLQRLTHRLESLDRRWRAARTRRAALEQQIAPLVDRHLREMQQLIDLGELHALLWRDALTRSLETRQAMLDATLEEAAAGAALRALVTPCHAIAPATAEHKEHR